jgi:hypothetical protein
MIMNYIYFSESIFYYCYGFIIANFSIIIYERKSIMFRKIFLTSAFIITVLLLSGNTSYSQSHSRVQLRFLSPILGVRCDRNGYDRNGNRYGYYETRRYENNYYNENEYRDRDDGEGNGYYNNRHGNHRGRNHGHDD